MEENIIKKKFSYQEMQELLPDYVFKRISAEDKEIFERTLPEFTDVLDEIKQVKQVFSKVEKMDLDKHFIKKTRNMSVKINRRLFAKNPIARNYNFIFRYLVPTFGLVILAFVLLSENFSINIFNNNNIEGISKTNDKPELKILSSAEASVILNDEITDSTYIQFSSGILPAFGNHHSSLANTNDEKINDALDNIIAENVFTDDNTDIGDFLFKTHSDYNNILNGLKDMDESEFQEILKEIENAKFPS